MDARGEQSLPVDASVISSWPCECAQSLSLRPIDGKGEPDHGRNKGQTAAVGRRTSRKAHAIYTFR